MSLKHAVRGTLIQVGDIFDPLDEHDSKTCGLQVHAPGGEIIEIPCDEETARAFASRLYKTVLVTIEVFS